MVAIPYTVYRRIPRRIPKTLGFSRYCLYFNRTLATYVQIPDDPSLNFGPNQDFRVEFFFRPNLLGTRQGMYMKFVDDGPGIRGYYVRFEDINAIRANIVFNGGWSANAFSRALSLGVLYYVTVNFDRDGNITIYINGDSTGATLANIAAMAGNDLSNSYNPRIGIEPGNALEGYLDGFLIYDSIGSVDDILYNMMEYHAPIDDMHLWLDFEEGQGLVTNDRSDQGNHGALLPALNPPAWTRVQKWGPRVEIGL